MRKVSDSTRPNSRSDCAGESTNSGDGSEMFANIKSANRKVRLRKALLDYGIKIEKNFQRPAWSNNIICPLPNHKGAKERTPSFAYCFVSDHFHCLGCGQSGRAVEFISLYENLPRSVIAERINSQFGDDLSEDDYDYEDDLSPILLDGSKYLQKIVQKHKNNPRNLAQIRKAMQWFDFYLMSKAAVSASELKGRIDRMKALIEEFV